MIQDTLLFSTKFNVVPATAKFVLTDLTPYAGEGIALTNVKGVFKIEGPSGIIYNNTNFGAPDITANVSLIFNTVSLPLGADGKILKGTYTITYKVRVAGGVQPGDYTLIDTSYYCYVAPSGDTEVTNSVRLAKVTSRDLTSYPIDGVMPTLTRTHTLYYPATLALSPTVSSTAEIQLSYPNVYTGTYSGKISTIASYVFTDGLIVDYLITAVDETIVDNQTLCDIYCGIKNLTNEMLAARSTGDFGKAGKIEETLSLIGMFFQLYDTAITCGKEDDATNWLNQIVALGNIAVGCGCTGDEPSLVIPEGGGGSSNDVVVNGDNSFGTEVSSATAGLTTTYTVRLTQAYKDLILSALQTQDLSVAAFRAAGIPEEARGVTVTPVTSGGGTISLTPGTSKKILVLTGTATLTSALTVQTVGSPIDGDSFIVDYRATLTPNGNAVTIFGLGLSPGEAASGNCLIYTWYAASNTTWYSKLISNDPGSAIQDGLNFWVNGSDYALNKTVLYGTNPSLIYRNILSAGSGTNAPSGTTSNNTYWAFVGNKSALYDGFDNVFFDVSGGQPFFPQGFGITASPFDFLVQAGNVMYKKAAADTNLAGMKLTTSKILVGGASNIAAEQTLNTAFFRTIPIGGITGDAFNKSNLINSGNINLNPAVSAPTVVIDGTVTLIGNVTITANVPTSLQGDYFWIDYKAAATLGGNTLTILGVSISATDALAGNFAIYGYFDSVANVWVGRRITYGIAIPVGTVNQTVRYNASNVLEADPNVTQDSTGNLKAARSISITGNTAGVGSIVAGSANTDTGNNNTITGVSNTVSGNSNNVIGSSNNVTGTRCLVLSTSNNVSGDSNLVAGSTNTVSGLTNLVSGNNNTVSGNRAFVQGENNTATGIKAIIGNNNTGAGSGVSVIAGNYNNLNGRDATIVGDYAINYNNNCLIFSNSTSGAIAGKAQSTEALFRGTTGSAASVFLTNTGATSLRFGVNECHIIFVKVAAYQTAGAAGAVGDSFGMIIKAMVKSIGGVYSIVGTQVIDGAFSDAAASLWTAVLQASSSGFDIVVAGQVNKNINWTAHVSTLNAG